MKTGATNRRIRDLIQAVREGKLLPRADFQRRLVWSRDDKNKFIDTILRSFPFPEIYFADGDVDLNTGTGTQLLVDGLQRVSTIIQYFEGDSDLKLTTVPPYKELEEDQKKSFLQYEVAVRDLGAISREEIIETFRRLNATKYSLLDIEVNNAVYAGALKQYADKLAAAPFFERHNIFNAQDLKRMGDLRYALSIVITMISGYFNRDDEFGNVLERFNDDFPLASGIEERTQNVLSFIDECGFAPSSRVWRKADLFTLIIELDHIFTEGSITLQPSIVVNTVDTFFNRIDTTGVDSSGLPGIYYKAALQASNDKLNRVRRGIIIAELLKGTQEPQILANLTEQGLIS